jgi:GNAT superfamily N-acetyltransferase
VTNIHECRRGRFVVTTDRSRIDLTLTHEFLTRAYWAEGIPRALVARSLEHSLPFGIFEGSAQVGFARVITDYSTFAYLADVFVVPSHRGRGLGKLLIECVLKHPDLQGLRRWMLATRDAHELYGQFGFAPLSHPERFMEIHDREIYKRSRS